MEVRFFDITLPAIWASYLINGDASGLEESDIAQCDKDTKHLGHCVTVGDDTWPERYRGILHDVASYQFAEPVAPKDVLKQILCDVNTIYGAPTGRKDVGSFGRWPGFVYDRKIRLDSGGYDRGGAYWGTGKELRVAFNGALTYIRFYRK